MLDERPPRGRADGEEPRPAARKTPGPAGARVPSGPITSSACMHDEGMRAAGPQGEGARPQNTRTTREEGASGARGTSIRERAAADGPLASKPQGLDDELREVRLAGEPLTVAREGRVRKQRRAVAARRRFAENVTDSTGRVSSSSSTASDAA